MILLQLALRCCDEIQLSHAAQSAVHVRDNSHTLYVAAVVDVAFDVAVIMINDHILAFVSAVMVVGAVTVSVKIAYYVDYCRGSANYCNDCYAT